MRLLSYLSDQREGYDADEESQDMVRSWDRT